MTISDFNIEATVGIIGLGIMGSAFASNLLSRGYNVHVYLDFQRCANNESIDNENI